MTKKASVTTETPNFRAIVNADYFRRAWEATSKEDSRYYLQGVYITPDPRGGALLVATDGHMLVCIRDAKAIITGSAIVRLNKAMIAALRSKTPSGFIANTGPYLLVEQDSDRLRHSRAYVAHMDDSLAAPGISTRIDVNQPYSVLQSIFDRMDGRVVCFQGFEVLIDGHFPDFRRVVPKDLKGTTLPPTISAKVMNALYAALTTGPRAKPTGHLTFYSVPTPEGVTESANPIMAIPGHLDGEPFEAFGVAMPMRTDSKTVAPPLWWLSYMCPESGGPKRKTGGLSDADVEHLKNLPTTVAAQKRAVELEGDLKAVEPNKVADATTIPNTAKPPVGGPFPVPGQTGYCHADRDGECRPEHKGHICPQLRDNEPAATGRHCPDDNRPPEE